MLMEKNIYNVVKWRHLWMSPELKEYLGWLECEKFLQNFSQQVRSFHNDWQKRLEVNFINISHTHFSYKILEPKITKPNVTRETLLNLLLYKKLACMCRSQKRKKTVKLSVFIALLWTARAKAAHRTLMKLTLGWQFVSFCSNVLRFLPHWNSIWGTILPIFLVSK